MRDIYAVVIIVSTILVEAFLIKVVAIGIVEVYPLENVKADIVHLAWKLEDLLLCESAVLVLFHVLFIIENINRQ